MEYTQLETEYFATMHRIHSLAKPEITPQMSDDALLAQIKDNAAQSYALMRRDNQILDELLYPSQPELLTDKEIAALAEFVGRLFNYSQSEDCGIAYKIHCLLLDAARARKDDVLIIKELYYCGVSLYYINDLSLPDGTCLFGERIRAYFEEAVNTYFPRYEEFDNDTRCYLIRCLGNCKMRMPHCTAEQCVKYYRVLDRAVNIMSSSYYRELNPEIPWDSFECSMKMDQMAVTEYLRRTDDPDPYLVRRVLDAANWCHENKAFYHPYNAQLQNWRVEYFYHAARYYAGLDSPRVVAEYLLGVAESADPEDFSPRGVNVHLFLITYVMQYRQCLSAEDSAQLAKRIDGAVTSAMNYLSRAYARANPRLVNDALHFLVDNTADADASSLKQVFEYFLAGHSPTYIHSLMVAMLTEKLVHRLLKTDPMALSGVLGCTTPRQLRKNAARICELAYKCGLYHDLGKSMVLMYISDNTRRLLDEEFECIKQHPIYGYALLCKLGHKDDFAQAALYHHCFYDGSSGYPMDAAPCPADIKPIVDALSVADSLDAATDGIGRCYTMAKSYDTLINEVRAQSGTRYSPAVAALFDDKEFYDDMRQTMYSERNRIYVEVYRSAGKRLEDAERAERREFSEETE